MKKWSIKRRRKKWLFGRDFVKFSWCDVFQYYFTLFFLSIITTHWFYYYASPWKICCLFTIFHFGIAIFLVKSRTSLTAFANTESKSYFVKSGTNVNASFQISTRTSLSCVLSIISHIGDLGRCWSRFWSRCWCRCWCRCWFLIVCIKGIELLGVIFLVFIIKENV